MLIFPPGYFLDIMLEIPYNSASTREKVTIFIRYLGLIKNGNFQEYSPLIIWMKLKRVFLKVK